MRDFERWAKLISTIVMGLFTLLLWLRVVTLPVTIVQDNTQTNNGGSSNGGSSAQATAYYEVGEENPGFVRVS